MIRVLFFDDYPNATENQSLLDRLKRSGIQVTPIMTTRDFEQAVRQTAYDAVILDVMARASGVMCRYDNPNIVVPDEETGLELLRRLRGGYYKEHAKDYADIPIFVRTANSALHMQALYEKEGGRYVDLTDDKALVKMILEQPTPKGTSDGKGSK